MAQDTYYELSKRSIPLSKNIGTNITWSGSVICVCTDKGVNFFDFSYNLECYSKGIDVYEYSVPSPKNSPAAALCNRTFIENEMKNYDYTEMIVDSSFWPHNSSLTQEMTTVNKIAWSPTNFIESRSVCAILNNIGGVEMFNQQLYQWKSILDLSPFIQNYLEYNRTPKTFEELKAAVYTVESCSICWAPKLNSDHSCYFITAQKNATILFWQIFHINNSPVIKGKIQAHMTEIINMLWIPWTDTVFWLICADILGQVNAFVVQIDNGVINLIESVTLWQCKDRMIASDLQYTIINDKVLIFFSKHRHFIAQVLDNNCKLLSQYIKNINDYKITEIARSLSAYYISTINAKLFKLIISLLDNTVNVELTPVTLKETYNTYEFHSLCFSLSNTLCVLGIIDRKLLCRKEVLKLDLVFISTESKLNAVFPLILNNPSKMLTNYWDCVEALRFNIIKTKTMPCIDFSTLYNEGSNDIYKLKIYLILLILYLNMLKMARVPPESSLPELSIDSVKEKILLSRALSILDKLGKRNSYNDLSMLEKESLVGCVNFIEYYSKIHKSDISVSKDAKIFKNEYKFEYVCDGCDCMISEGFTCSNGHLNMYCMLSLTRIISDDYIVCKCCNSTARNDLEIDNALCVFCDQQLLPPT